MPQVDFSGSAEMVLECLLRRQLVHVSDERIIAEPECSVTRAAELEALARIEGAPRLSGRGLLGLRGRWRGILGRRWRGIALRQRNRRCCRSCNGSDGCS